MGASTAPVDRGSYSLLDSETYLFNVEVPDGMTELLVGVRVRRDDYLNIRFMGQDAELDGYFVLPVESAAPLDSSAVARTRTLTLTVLQPQPQSTYEIQVAARRGSEVTAALQLEYFPSAWLQELDPCYVPFALENNRLIGGWAMVGGDSWILFPPHMRFRWTFWGGGLWEGGGTLRATYGLGFDNKTECVPDGSYGLDALVEIPDAQGTHLDTLAVFIGYEFTGPDTLQVDHAWPSRHATYRRLTPRPSTFLPSGSAVVPYVLGLPLETGSSQVADAGFALGPVQKVETRYVPAHTVVDQIPRGGTVAPLGSSVALTVSIPEHLTIDLEHEELWANGRETIVCTITAHDDDARPAPGRIIQVSAEPEQGTVFFPASIGSTNEAGRVEFILSTTHFGRIDLTARDQSEPEREASATVLGIVRRAVVFVQGINSSIGMTTPEACEPGSAPCQPSEWPAFPKLRKRLLDEGFQRAAREEPEVDALVSDGVDDDGDGVIDDGTAMVLDYSYLGREYSPAGIWVPADYACSHTAQSLMTSLERLESMIDDFLRENPNTQFVVVGHSQGGFLALQSLSSVRPVGKGVNIDCVVTLDGVLGGESGLGLLMARLTSCWGNPAAEELEAIYWSAARDHPESLGTMAIGLSGMRNMDLVTLAQRCGTRVMTVGNSDDCVFAPGRCQIPQPVHSSTQIVENADWAWLLPLGGNCPLTADCIVESHSRVLEDPEVLDDVLEFIGEPVILPPDEP